MKREYDIAHAMRAFYTTYENIRVFVLGIPEGWQVGVYDLLKQHWEMDEVLHETLKGAKAAGEQYLSKLTGKKSPGVKWH